LKPTILIFDDDTHSRTFLTALLETEFSIISFPCFEHEPISLIKEHQPALILIDSFVLCKKIKADPASAGIPVFVLSSRNTSTDIAEGLALGAEDFIPKPFDHKELQLRVRAQIKKFLAGKQSHFIRVGSLEIDTNDRTAKFNNETMNLTITEYDILRLLASRKGEVISREDIMKSIWKDSATEITDRTIDVHIRSLRKKVPELSDHIKSVYGVGYQYQE
jgi:DNA-binding response OmpR family regulator